MFIFGKKKKNISIYAPVNGKCVSIEEVPDKTFSEKMLGDGVAIIPIDGVFCSPANGKISFLSPDGHAFSIMLDNDVEILVHIGLDTYEMIKENINILKTEGSKVKVGTPCSCLR